MPQYELGPNQSVQTRRGLVRVQATYGATPVRLEFRYSTPPEDASAQEQLWTRHGDLWVGTFSRPLTQLPQRAALFATVANGEFPVNEKLAVTIDIGNDLLTIVPRSLGGCSEALVAEIEFFGQTLVFKDSTPVDQGTVTPARAAVRSALRSREVSPEVESIVVAVDLSASMRGPASRQELETLLDCVEALAGEATPGNRPALLGLEKPEQSFPSRAELFGALDANDVLFGSSLSRYELVAALVAPDRMLYLVSDDLPVWLADSGARDMRGRVEVVLLGYPGPAPERVGGCFVTRWSAASTDMAAALTEGVRHLVRPMLRDLEAKETAR